VFAFHRLRGVPPGAGTARARDERADFQAGPCFSWNQIHCEVWGDGSTDLQHRHIKLFRDRNTNRVETGFACYRLFTAPATGFTPKTCRPNLTASIRQDYDGILRRPTMPCRPTDHAIKLLCFSARGVYAVTTFWPAGTSNAFLPGSVRRCFTRIITTWPCGPLLYRYGS
jgi:hypothetical protein